MNDKAGDALRFFGDKWRHHDNIAYQRLHQFLVLQSIVATGITVSALNSKKPYIIALLFLGSLLGWFYLRMFNKDITVRNAFNREIVDILNNNGLLVYQVSEADRTNWLPSSPRNKFNLWHVSEKDQKDTKGLASVEARYILSITSVIEAMVATLLVILQWLAPS